MRPQELCFVTKTFFVATLVITVLSGSSADGTDGSGTIFELTAGSDGNWVDDLSASSDDIDASHYQLDSGAKDTMFAVTQGR